VTASVQAPMAMPQPAPAPAPDPEPSPAEAGSRRNPAVWLAVALIKVYRWVFAWRSSPCRYDPTCSSYALEAVETHGAARGTWLALRRLGRCHPWGGHGWDPVPPRKAS
jgi:putative membrane protein insertion efficiency factor